MAIFDSAKRFIEEKKKRLKPVIQTVQKKAQSALSSINSRLSAPPVVSKPTTQLVNVAKKIVEPVKKAISTYQTRPSNQLFNKVAQPVKRAVVPMFQRSASQTIPNLKASFVPTSPEFKSKTQQFTTQLKKAPNLAQSLEGIRTGVVGLDKVFDTPLAPDPKGFGQNVSRYGSQLASGLAQAAPIAGLFKGLPIVRNLQQPLGRYAGMRIAQGGVSKLFGKGVANVSQGIPYTLAFNALNATQRSPQATGGGVAADVGLDLALGSLPIVGGLLTKSKGAKQEIKNSLKKTGKGLLEKVVDSRPAHQVQIETLLNAGKDKEARVLIDSLPDTDLYKKSMQSLMSTFEKPVEQIPKTAEQPIRGGTIKNEIPPQATTPLREPIVPNKPPVDLPLDKSIASKFVRETRPEKPPVIPKTPISDVTNIIKSETKSPIAKDVENLKDISGFMGQARDVFRNFKAVYGKRFDEVKQLVLDPFVESKGRFIDDLESWAGKLHKEIEVDLGIRKGSKESAAVQEFGEGNLDQASLIKQFGEIKAEKIVQADNWFRTNYDQLLNEVNKVRETIYPNDSTKIIPYRQDYYRHFKEMQQGFQGLRNIFDTPANIESSLAGVSEFTKPKSKWLSIAQRRLGVQTDVDAVGGFLDYIRASSYAINIDPNIPVFRNLANELAQSTLQGTPNAGKLNNFIEFLQDFSNDLSGKTNPADRYIQKVVPGGRQAFKVINWMNNRVKANVILGNVSSSIAQIFNVPQGMASVQNPKYWVKGAGDSLASIFVKNQPINQSIFLKERNFNAFDQFDRGMINNTKKFATWMIKVLDEVGSKYIWNMHYEKALAENIAKPISYADNLTREMVAGRGVGEVPLLQKSRVFQLIAPFQLEVGNLWFVMKDFVDEKAFGKLATLFVTSYVFNRAAEQIRGTGVSFDPIEAIKDAFNTYQEEEDKKVGLIRAGGRVAGEVLSNVPLGQTAASFYPEYGVTIPGTNETLTRKEFFGKEDPTRFGGGGLLTRGLQDPLYKLIPPFGGQQFKRTLEGIGAVGQGYSETKTGRVRFPIAQNLSNIIQGGIFGQYAVPEARTYFKENRLPLGTNQSELFKASDNPSSAYSDIMEVRRVNKQKETQKKSDIERMQPIYDELQTIKQEQGKAEADKIYFKLSPEDRKIYQSIKTSAKTKEIDALKVEMYPLVKEFEAMKAQGRKAEADEIYFSWPVDKRKAYKKAKKELGY